VIDYPVDPFPELASLRDIAKLLERIADKTVRQESPSPTLITLCSGKGVAQIFKNQSVRFRTKWLIITNHTGGSVLVGIKFGTASRYTHFVVNDVAYAPIPLETVIEPGADVQAWDETNNAAVDGTKMTVYLIAYAEAHE
jgi:hypothetical protein